MFSQFRIVNFAMLIIHFTLFSLLSAGAPDTLWTRTYGGAGSDFGYSVQQTSDGGFIITGTTNSIGAGNYDVYLIRTNANGDTIWTKAYGGSEYDEGQSVQQTTDGGYIIAGMTESFGANSEDVYLIRTDSIGDTLWTKIFGGNYDDKGNSVQQTSDGGFVITGYSFVVNSIDNDLYLIRTDYNGDTLWTKTYGDTGIDVGNSVMQINGEGYIIAGHTSSIGAGESDVYILRTKTDGDTLWTKTYGGDKIDGGFSIHQTSDGGFILAGLTSSFGAGYEDVYIIRTNSSGDTLWTKTYGGDKFDNGYSAHQTSDGGLIITGSTGNYDSLKGDVYIIRTDSNGDTLWTKTYGGTNSDQGWSAKQTSDGGFIIAGYTYSFGDDAGDIYLIRLDKDTTGIQEEIPYNFIDPNNFIVSHDHGNISINYIIPYSTSVKLEAYDIKGKLVKVITDKFMQKGSYSVNWDSKRFGSGVYFLRLSAAGSEVSRKVTLIR